jgi:DNA-binding CsgD family transcriptional regulator
MLSLPVKVNSQVQFVITLYSGRPGDYLLQAMPVLRLLADAAALCSELIDLRRITHRQERHLLALHEMSRLLAMSLDPVTVLSLSVDVATGLLNLDLCCILTTKDGKLQVQAARGAVPSDVLAVPDAGEPDLAPFRREGLVTECLPIQNGAERLGYLVIGRRTAGISDVDRRLLTTWTNVAGVLLDNVRLHADASGARQNAVSVLLAALESAAPGSRDLALSRSELAGRLAHQLKLPEAEVRTIETAALLQEAGLLAAGEMHARVLAVADAFVRLRTGAANQPPANDAAALITMKERAGKQFDPGMVAALEAVIWPQLRLAPQIGPPAPEVPEGSRAAAYPEVDLRVLTRREREILQWVALGCSNREIAAALFLSEATVKTHVSRILQKLSLPDRTKAAVYLMRGRVHPGL